MSLLPRSHTQFQLKSYWEKFFRKRSTPFEWYGQYTDLCHVLHKYIKSSSKTLVVGCGNSKLSEDMYDAGITDITNIDISEVVVKKMGARNFEKRPQMIFTPMDMLSMSFSDSTFDCVLDKGTLDAIYSNSDDATVSKVSRMWSEVERVMKAGGRYLCVTLAQEHILSGLLERFASGWVLRAHKVVLCEGGDGGRGGVGASLPVIVFVMTKMLSLPGKPALKVYEVMGDDGKCVRCEDVEGVRDFVKAAQQHAMLLYHLKDVHPGEPGVQVQLWSETVSTEPRYTFTIIDIDKIKAKSGLFAIFIVPQGREGDWLFSSDAGLRGLAEQSGYQRLVVVAMHCGHQYSDLDHVKDEVSGNVLTMLQTGVPDNIKLPVLSTGEGVGCRVCLCEGVSLVSGRWRVEECEEGEGEGGGEGKVRRLVFTETSRIIQTEMRLRPGMGLQKKKKKARKGKALSASTSLLPDSSYLTFAYHRAILATLSLTPDIVGGGGGGGGGRGGVGRHVLIVGLGGGALPTFIHRYLPQVTMEVCELDSELVEVAEKWFGFERDASRMTLHIGDGIEFVKRCAADEKKRALFSAVILDVDSKDLRTGISCPPLAFVEPAFLTAVRSLLTENGILVTNVAARNEEMKLHVLCVIQEVFCTLVCLPLQEDINDVVVAMKECPSNGIECRNQYCSRLSGTESNTNDERPSANESVAAATGILSVADTSQNDKVTNGRGPSINDSITADSKKSDCSSPDSGRDGATNNGRGFSSITTNREGARSLPAPMSWESSSVGDSEVVRGRVCDLVRVIGENGGYVEGLEQELTAFLVYKTQ